MFVPAATATEPREVLAAIGRAVGADLTGVGSPMEGLVELFGVGRWLLIVDNADDMSMAQPYLPIKGNGSILLTTRASAAGWLAPSLEVDTMGLMEGAELLLRRAALRRSHR